MHPTHIQADPDPVTPAITLRSAALYLERHGWIQNAFYATASADSAAVWPAACALGAIAVTVHGRVSDDPMDPNLPGGDTVTAAYTMLRGYLLSMGEMPDIEHATVGDWNDHPQQTASAVIAALREAAADWDRTHGGTR